MFGTCLAPAPVLSPLSTSVLLPLTASAPGALLLSACVSPDAGLMLGQAQDPSLALSPTGGGTSLHSASSAEAAQAGMHTSMRHSLLTFQDVSLKCSLHSRGQVLLVCPQVLGIKQRWFGGSAAEGSKSGGCDVAINHYLLQNKIRTGWILTLFWPRWLHGLRSLGFFCHPGPLQLSRLLHILIWIQQVCFHVLPPCSFPFCCLYSRWGAGFSTLHVAFVGSLNQKFLCHPCPRQLIPSANLQADAAGATITSQGHGKGLPSSWKMHRQLHPWPIYPAQNLEQLQVFIFVLGLNICLAISQNYLRCRGVVRLHNLTQPVTSHRWIAGLQKASSFGLV